MADFWSWKYAACPYYIGSRECGISCEPKTVLRFPDRQATEEWLDRYCGEKGCWQDCQWAKMMNDWYERTL